MNISISIIYISSIISIINIISITSTISAIDIKSASFTQGRALCKRYFIAGAAQTKHERTVHGVG